jgi:DNA-binding MarR family transcriptional regulator
MVSTRTEADDALLPQEADVLARVAHLPVDLAALTVISNVWRAGQAVRSSLERDVLRGEDLSWAGFSLLFCLWVWGPSEIREIARSLHASKPTITGVAATLERRGLVRRGGDERDRRLVRMELTAEGQRLVEELFPRFNAGESALAGGLTEDEQQTLARLLRKVIRTAREERADEPDR